MARTPKPTHKHSDTRTRPHPADPGGQAAAGETPAECCSSSRPSATSSASRTARARPLATPFPPFQHLEPADAPHTGTPIQGERFDARARRLRARRRQIESVSREWKGRAAERNRRDNDGVTHRFELRLEASKAMPRWGL